MDNYIIVVLISILKLAAATSVFGIALWGNFKKCGVAPWKAVVPFYNLMCWLKLTRNPSWYIILLLQFYILPLWWVTFFLSLIHISEPTRP